jgi:hypothetical protein
VIIVVLFVVGILREGVVAWFVRLELGLVVLGLQNFDRRIVMDFIIVCQRVIVVIRSVYTLKWLWCFKQHSFILLSVCDPLLILLLLFGEFLVFFLCLVKNEPREWKDNEYDAQD